MAIDPNILGDDQSFARTMMDRLADNFDEDEATAESLRGREADALVVDFYAKVIGDYDVRHPQIRGRLLGFWLPLYTGATCLIILSVGWWYGRAYVPAAFSVQMLILALLGLVLEIHSRRLAVDFARGSSLLALDEPAGDFAFALQLPLELGSMSSPTSRLTRRFALLLVSGPWSTKLRLSIAEYRRGEVEAVSIKRTAVEIRPDALMPLAEVLEVYVDGYRDTVLSELRDLIAAYKRAGDNARR